MAYAAMPERGDSAFRQSQGSASRQGHDRRAREFERAKRHSARVRTLKVLLPLAACGIVSLYALPSLLSVSVDNGRGQATVRAITLDAGSLKMLDPRIKGVNEKQDAYDFVADSATQASKNADVMYLDKIRGKVVSQDGKITTLTAPNGVHNNKADEMTFNNGVVVKREPDMTATFETATAYMKQQTVISKTPVVVRLRESTIHSDNMTLHWGEQRAIFEGNVRTHIERQPAEDGSQPQTQPLPTTAWSVGSDPAR